MDKALKKQRIEDYSENEYSEDMVEFVMDLEEYCNNTGWITPKEDI